jgi:hypothetical protein
MKRISVGGLCLVVALAITAATATGASALPAPEFKACLKVAKGTGEYADKYCQSKVAEHNGRYSLESPAGGSFGGKSSNSTAWHVPGRGGFEITCGKSRSSGHLGQAAPFDTVYDVELKFTDCETPHGLPCNSLLTQNEGEIITKDLKGKLGIISGEQVGISLTAQTGSVFAEFTCGVLQGRPFRIEGALVGRLTPEGPKYMAEEFAVTEAGEQVDRGFEGGPTEVLEGTIDGEGPFPVGVQDRLRIKTGKLVLKP